MKILSIDKVREGDAFTIKQEPVNSIDLMERAARRCFLWIHDRFGRNSSFVVFAGLGNNGGDGLALARMLRADGHKVRVYIIRYSERSSADFGQNLLRLDASLATDLHPGDPLPVIEPGEIIVDAMFGSGLSGPLAGFVANLVRHINEHLNAVISIDAPTGLFSDKCSKSQADNILKADHTLSFQYPKLAFMFAENEPFVGQWHILPIGIHPGFTDQASTFNYYTEAADVIALLRRRSRFDHKGRFGHALLVAGSFGKMGAAVLAARAALRGGAGLVTASIPKEGYDIMQTAIPEVMVETFRVENIFLDINRLSAFNAIAAGPGIGMADETQQALKLLIQNSPLPLLLDADALNILSENKTWLAFLPPGSILTPHPREFERLAGKSADDFERNQMQRDFSFRFNSIVVLKGAYTCISFPDGRCFFNSTGNPGMATGGSGDVLTGIILGLLAQGYQPGHAAILGVFLHGLAGDLAAAKNGQEALIAGDITEHLPAAFLHLWNIRESMA